MSTLTAASSTTAVHMFCAASLEDQIEPRWHKSSYSGNGGGDCVEVARNLPGVVAVRDSKNPHGPVLTVSTDEWARFITRLRSAA